MMESTRDKKQILEEAVALQKAGNTEHAEKLYQEVLTLDPLEPNALHLLGVIAWQRNNLKDSEAYMRKAIAVHPKAPSYHSNLAGLLLQKGDHDNAIVSYEIAFQLAPLDQAIKKTAFQLLHSYGVRLQSEDRYEAAERIFQRILKFDPVHQATLNSLSELLINLGQRHEALELLNRLLALDPHHFIAQFNRGICYLALGKLEEGWLDLEKTAPFWLKGIDQRRDLPWLRLPLWNGSDLKGKKILVWGDPGIGDEILFASLLPELLASGGHVTIECTDRLKPLFSRSFPDLEVLERIASPKEAHYDWQIPSLLVGRFLRPQFALFPGTAFLKADEKKAKALREKYRAHGKKKIIGLSWATKTARWGNFRHVSLEEILKSLAHDDVLFLDLQYGDRKEDRKKLCALYPDLKFIHDASIDQLKDLDGFAAQVVACDFIITIANTTPHMAGALGVKTAVLLPAFGLTWYWFSGEGKNPWYQSLELFAAENRDRMTHIESMVKELR